MTDDVSEKKRNRERRQLVKKQQRIYLKTEVRSLCRFQLGSLGHVILKQHTAREEESFRPKGPPILKRLFK